MMVIIPTPGRGSREAHSTCTDNLRPACRSAESPSSPAEPPPSTSLGSPMPAHYCSPLSEAGHLFCIDTVLGTVSGTGCATTKPIEMPLPRRGVAHEGGKDGNKKEVRGHARRCTVVLRPLGDRRSTPGRHHTDVNPQQLKRSRWASVFTMPLPFFVRPASTEQQCDNRPPLVLVLVLVLAPFLSSARSAARDGLVSPQAPFVTDSPPTVLPADPADRAFYLPSGPHSSHPSSPSPTVRAVATKKNPLLLQNSIPLCVSPSSGIPGLWDAKCGQCFGRRD